MKKIALFLVIAVFGILSVSAQTTKPIGMGKAKEIALKQASGKILHSQTLKESGKPVYLVDVKSKSGDITKLKIDSTGSVLDKTTINASSHTAKVSKPHKKKHWWIF